ncbi:MAG TPA: SMP-30/gluconolactonase/LRE family protein, partial [Planctomycetota bacterium]|nr:SMP-30/gluconolactonase/LRE family protein [Planctomycetota bacterium]
MTIEAVAEDGNRCGEGPIWDAPRRRLLWDDNAANLVFAWTPGTGEKTVLSRDLMASGIAIDRSGGLLFGGSGGLHLWRGPGDHRTLVGLLNINDMIADPRGRIFAGTCYWGAGRMEKHGALYRIEPVGACAIVEEGLELANGLGFSPDDRTLYCTDSAQRRIFAYDYRAETGEISRRRVFVQVPGSEGIPDGLTVDREGFVWSAQWYGGQIVRYDPDGAVERRISMPVQQVSSIAFGGNDGTDLYVTTAAEAWPSPLAPPGYDVHRPQGGALYRLRL